MNAEELRKEFDHTYTFQRNIQNDKKSYESLVELYNIINTTDSRSILLDFSKVSFLSANLLALLGACVDNETAKTKERIAICNLEKKIKAVMQKNGFHRYFKWEHIKDTYNTTVDYKVFFANTQQLVDFEKYLQINIFSRNELPLMNERFKTEIIDNFLEMFNNVIDHAHSDRVYVCGQFFHRSSNLAFTIVDIGKTINENVTNYFQMHAKEFDENSLEWAIKLGNSTKGGSEPGGLGFGMLLKFLKLNKGKFELLSKNEFYSLNQNRERFSYLDNSFPGTIVTITINLADDSIYMLDEAKQNMIIF